jgi:hypothetical protein
MQGRSAPPDPAQPAPGDDRVRAANDMADALLGLLRVAGALSGNGHSFDLAGLEIDLGRLCAYALDLPPEHGRLFRYRLNEIVAELDALTALMEARGPR